MAGRPGVQVEGAHLGDVGAQVAVDAGTLDADEDAEIETSPGGVGRTTVDTVGVARNLGRKNDNQYRLLE